MQTEATTQTAQNTTQLSPALENVKAVHLDLPWKGPLVPFQVIVTDPRVFAEDGSVQQFTQGTPGSAGYDLVAWPDEPVVIKPGECKPIPTGVKLWIGDSALVGLCFPRSGRGAKDGLVIGNLVGVIDSDYQGPATVYAWNRNPPRVSNQPYKGDIVINPGDRIAQIVFTYAIQAQFTRVEEFQQSTFRGDGGFGSSGVGVSAADASISAQQAQTNAQRASN
jgi:dUTP pyrophosphatase